MADLSSLPSVERLLQTDQAGNLTERFGRALTLRAIHSTLDGIRSELATQTVGSAPPMHEILSETEALLAQWTAASLREVINATGVILHTNLGRAPLSGQAIASMLEVARAYANVEFDLATGKRGQRSEAVEAALRRLTGAEAALVVNNNAAAVLLILSVIASRKRVAIARSQLVEIGGGFRMPDVMRQSGAKLVEVGTTNKVRLSDYEDVFGETALVLRAHRSNFKMVGFTEDPDFEGLVRSAHAAGQIVVDDLGSGALLDTSEFGLAHEPTAQESVRAGADLICFSGDKLLGGPQAGLIIGRAALVDRLRRHPLARTIRADKLSLAGLMATLLHYLKDEAVKEVPVWRMISMPAEAIQKRARAWAAALGTGAVVAAESTLGGGSLPGETLPTFVLSIAAERTDALLRSLRSQSPPVIGRTEKGAALLDPRTVKEEQDDVLTTNVKSALRDMK